MKQRSILAAALCAAMVQPALAQEKRTSVKVGLLTDMSGGLSDVAGPGSIVAAKMAIEDWGGKVKGLPIEFVSADHQNKADIGSSIARKWIDVDKVDALVDLPNSSVALAVSEIVKGANKAVFVTAGASSRLTGDACSPNTIHFATDNWTLANVPSKAIVGTGGDSWFYVTADYAFGHDIEKQSGAAVEKAGGKVLGSVKHPFAVADFSSFLLQAQASKAKVVGFANSQGDFINAVRQAAEFNLQSTQKLVGLAVYISDIEPIGLKIAQGSLLSEAFYWDMNDASRKFSKRFAERHNGKVPTSLQANVYVALNHYFKSIDAGADPSDGRAIVAKMKELPTEDPLLGKGAIRADGRMLSPMYLFEVKKPEESKERFDFYKLVRTIPVEEAFRPLADGNCPLIKK